jgi:hypothetical protein
MRQLMLSDNDLTTWLARIESEYREMPSLHLTEPQMERLWGLDRSTRDAVLDLLVSRGVLAKTRRDAYARADRLASAQDTFDR